MARARCNQVAVPPLIKGALCGVIGLKSCGISFKNQQGITGFSDILISMQKSASVVLGVNSDHGGEGEDSEEGYGKEEEREGDVFGDADVWEVYGLALGAYGSDSLPTSRTATPVFHGCSGSSSSNMTVSGSYSNGAPATCCYAAVAATTRSY